MSYTPLTTSLRPKARPEVLTESPRPKSRSQGLASREVAKEPEEKKGFWDYFDFFGGSTPDDDNTSPSDRASKLYERSDMQKALSERPGYRFGSEDMTLPEVPQVSAASELAPSAPDPYVAAVGTGDREVAPSTMDSYLQGDTDIEAVMPPAAPSGLMSPPTQEDTNAAVVEAIGATTGVSDNEIPTNIDFDFIGEQEGYRSSMYVPKDKKGKVLDSSGPTIGTGVDIGQRSVKGLKGLPQGLVDKLTPYVGKKGQEASDYVKDNALTLTKSEVETLNKWAKKQETDSLIKLCERDSDIACDSLTKTQATAVASVMYQYGSKKVRTPSFWGAATSGDWDKAEAELRDFGDKYSSRRIREANYLSGSN
jgi:GH24 family phage-related lysozyme (muramidase)